MAVSSKYTQDLSVQIVFFTLTCKWFLCFYFWAVIWSYIVDLFAALRELASASSRTLLKLASSVPALLKPYGDTLILISLHHATGHPSVQIFKRLMTKNQLFSGQIKKAESQEILKAPRRLSRNSNKKIMNVL